MAGSRGVAMLTALFVVISGAALSVAPQARASVPPEAGSFTALSPARILDTRTGNGAPRQAVAAGHTIAVQIAGRGGMPGTGVSAVALNVVVLGATGAQGVTVYPDGAARPGLVTFNYGPGQSAANLVTSGIGADGEVDLAVSGTGTVQLLADVTGYYSGGSPTAAGSFAPLPSARVLDTRTGNGVARQAVAAGHTIGVQVTGRGGVPATGVSAVALNVVVVGATGAQGVTVYPAGAARPSLVNMNYGAGPSTAHSVVSQVGADGEVDLFVSGTGTVQLLADVTGYYLAGTPTAAGSFGSLSPARVLDTRTGNGAARQAVAAGHTIAVQLTGRGGVPATGVSAVALNVVVIGATGAQGVTVYPDGAARPGLVDFDYGAGPSAAHLVLSKVGADGKVALLVSGTGTVQLLADVTGYYRAPPLPTLSWSAPAQAQPFHGNLTAVSCVPSSFCAAVDDRGDALTFDGTNWSSPLRVDAEGPLTGVSCVSSSFCIAVDAPGNALTFDGATWSSPAPIDPHGSRAVSCVSPAYCMAVDGSGYAVTYDGATWTSPTFANMRGLVSISCVSSSYCVGATGYDTAIWNGTFWAGSYTPAAATSCVSSTFCVVVDDQGNVDVFTGHSRLSQTKIDAVSGLTSVSCVSTSFCVAVDGAGNALSFDGTTWSSPTSIDGTVRLAAVSCAATSFCVALDRTPGNAVTLGGGTWAAPQVIDSLTGVLTSVSCATPSFCMAVDGGGAATSFDGTNWSAAVTIDSTSLTSVSCVSSSFCQAVDKTGHVVTYTGATWSTPRSIAGAGSNSISCSSTTFCVAVGYYGTSERFNGSLWTAIPSVDPQSGLGDVSCVSPTFCAATTGSGSAVTFDGARWSSPTSLDPLNQLVSVACTSAWFCVAIGNNFQAFVYNGSGWSAPEAVTSVRAVSCASPSFCVSVGWDGSAQTFNGVTWSAPVSPGVAELDAISCTAESLCVAISGDNRASAGSA